MMKRILVFIAAAMFLFSCACAEGGGAFVLDGKVTNDSPSKLYTVFGGTLQSVNVKAGQRVRAGDAAARMAVQKVFAKQSGTVYISGSVGDSAGTAGDDAAAAETGNAVLYIEPDVRYTVSASTRNAYDAEDNRVIHPGETVYIRATDSVKCKGTGIVTAVTSSSAYTVEITGGDMISSAGVYIFRSPDYVQSSRIGKGTITLSAPEAYTAEGVIIRYTAENGSHVNKGDELFEVMTGVSAGPIENADTVIAPENGVITEIAVNEGDILEAGSVVMTFWPDRALTVTAYAYEEDLPQLSVGMTARITPAGSDREITGTVTEISAVPETNDDGAQVWPVTLIPESTGDLYYGVSCEIKF